MTVGSGASMAIQNGTSLNIQGGIQLNDGSHLTNSGEVSISADFTDQSISAYNYGSGKFVFTGSSTQNIFSPNQFERIDVNTSILNLSSNIKSNTWYLVAGKVTTNGYAAIATSGAASAVTPDPSNTNFANSWFNGNLQRYITPSSVNNYQFPVGDATKVNLLEMDNLSVLPLTGVSYVTASFGVKAVWCIHQLTMAECGTSILMQHQLVANMISNYFLMDSMVYPIMRLEF
ncbi:MAG: hypothetical protein JST86_13810 [Bacteroidetes bacterium]|nr:hypothetical protein [Bacteroidota bacterium]